MTFLSRLVDPTARKILRARPVRVLIADRFASVRLGLAACVRAAPDMELVGEADSSEQTLALCASARPDVVLLDLFMPEVDGEMVTQLIGRAHPDIKIIAMDILDRRYLVELAMASGASDYITKDISTTELTHRIQTVART